MVAAVGAGESGFFIAADGTDDGGAQVFRPLTKDRADAAGGGMNKNGITLLDAIGAADQIMGGHALEHHGGGLAIVDAVRQGDKAVRRYQPFLGVGARRQAGVGDPLADLETGHFRA